MSLPVCLGFSAPVTCVPAVGNPMTMRDVIDAPNKKAIAGPVAKQSAPISFMLTHGVSKPLNVVRTVIVTFLETLVTKPIALKTKPANWRPTLSPPFALVDVAVLTVSSWKWEAKPLTVIGAGTWCVLPAASTWTVKPIVVSFRKRSPPKNSENRNVNANAEVAEVLVPNGGPPRGFKPYKPMKRRRRKTWTTTTTTTTTTPVHPSTCFFDIEAMQPQASIASEIFSNGWIPSRRTTRVKSMSWPIISKGTMGTLSSSRTTASPNSSVTGANAWKSNTIASVFSQFLPDAPVCLSQNLWTDGTEKGVVPPSIQQARTPNLRGTRPGPRLLHARNHVS